MATRARKARGYPPLEEEEEPGWVTMATQARAVTL